MREVVQSNAVSHWLRANLESALHMQVNSVIGFGIAPHGLPSQYPNQCWLGSNWIIRNKLQISLNTNKFFFSRKCVCLWYSLWNVGHFVEAAMCSFILFIWVWEVIKIFFCWIHFIWKCLFNRALSPGSIAGATILVAGIVVESLQIMQLFVA